MDNINVHRKNWLDILFKIVDPILINVANDSLKENMPVEYANYQRMKFSYLEAVGRVICGIAPWIELGANDTSEGKMREKYIDLVKTGLINICNPNSKDYLVFDEGSQPLVDVAFLAQGILRAKTQIWDSMSSEGKHLIINAFLKTRQISPYNSNWLLFASMIEAFFLETMGVCDEER